MLKGSLYYFPLDSSQIKVAGKISLACCTVDISNKIPNSVVITDLYESKRWVLVAATESQQLEWINSLRSSRITKSNNEKKVRTKTSAFFYFQKKSDIRKVGGE